MGRDFLTFFCTTQTGIRYQDKYNMANNVLGIITLRIPFMYMV
jgi:intraflagellar transport protein 140